MSNFPSVSELIMLLNANDIRHADYKKLANLSGGQKTALANSLKKGTHKDQAIKLLHGWGLLMSKSKATPIVKSKITDIPEYLATDKQAKYLADLELKYGYIADSFYEARIKEVLGMDRAEVSELINAIVSTPKRPPKVQPIESGTSALADELDSLIDSFTTKLKRGF